MRFNKTFMVVDRTIESSTRITRFPSITSRNATPCCSAAAVCGAGLLVMVLAQAFYYHFGAWGAVDMNGKTQETLDSFVESLKVTYPYYTLRLLGGLVFFAGMLIMVYNVYKTVRESKVAPVAVMEPA